jgi:hypothetical protein
MTANRKIASLTLQFNFDFNFVVRSSTLSGSSVSFSPQSSVPLKPRQTKSANGSNKCNQG